MLDILIVSSLHGYTVHSMRQVRLEIGMKHGVYLIRLLHDDDGNAKGESTREALLVMVESTGIVGWEKIVYC